MSNLIDFYCFIDYDIVFVIFVYMRMRRIVDICIMYVYMNMNVGNLVFCCYFFFYIMLERIVN